MNIGTLAWQYFKSKKGELIFTAWIESHQSIGRHPKLNKLRALSGWSKHEAIGVMHDLWHWVLTYAEDGDISRFTSSEIAMGIDIDPAKFDVQAFVDMLISAGFVRADLKMHDWLDYAGKYLTSKYRTNAPAKLLEIQKKYATKGSPSKVRLKSVQRAYKGRLPTVPNQQYLTVPTVPNQHNQPKTNKDNEVNKETIPAWLSLEAWHGYLEMRTKKKKPPTERAQKLIIDKLEKWRGQGHDPTEILNTATVNAWTDVYEPKPKDQGASNGKPSQTGLATKDYTAGLEDF